MTHDGYAFRKAAPVDAEALSGLRLLMFRDIAPKPFDEEAFRDLDCGRLRDELASGRTEAWLALDRDGRAVACCALTAYHLLPKPWNPEALYGYVSSMFTLPEHRRKGLGTHLARQALSRADELGMGQAALHASAMGRPLYEILGFSATNEMRLDLPPKS